MLTGPLRETHDYLLARFAGLLDVLLAERDALTGRSADALHEVIVRKETLCADIAACQQTLLKAVRPATTLPDSMAELRALADRCRSENALNGRIANRARRTTRTLLGILTGDHAPDLYDAPGRGQRAPATGHHLGSA
jgi:flagellar biosynthesis/type III secretory pathway chaperone